MKRRILAMVVCVCLLIGMSAVSGYAQQDGDKMIGFSNYMSISYFMNMAASARMTAEELGYSVIELRHEGDFSTRMKQIEDLVARGCKIIITELGESGSLSDYFVELRNQGIIIIQVDVPTEPYDYWIASDDREIGATAAACAVEYLTEKNGSPKGTIAMLSSKTVTSMIERCNGFREYLAEYPEITIVDERFPTEFDTTLMMSLTDDVLQVYPVGSLDAIFASNQTQLEGSNASVVSNARQDVVIFGVDDSDAIYEALQDPQFSMQCTVIQDPVLMGKVAVEMGVAIAGGDIPEDKIYRPAVQLVTRDNVADFIANSKATSDMLAPYQQ